MDDITIIFKATFKVIRYFFPAVIIFIIGLSIIAHDERRDKYNSNYKPFATQRRR